MYYRKILLGFPPLLVDKMDALAIKEFRTRSDLAREAVREYIERKTGVTPEVTKTSNPV